ncbi:CUB domain protein [Necator americanus]|uniref:CUB domain protein n=1 Tax=Necator americanus TaxID=51031 RepID=W2TTC4_NECAM|nr:CUB domain protein [Necator americanus]ETN84356.1 CUB domain protein [Necator americanus]
MTSNQRLPPWVAASRTSSGNWKWNTGVSVSSTYWATNEPSLYGDCATLRSNGMSACPCYNQQPAMCKLKPPLCNGGKFGGANIRFGTFNSPGYPDQYYNGLDCYYQIEGPASTYITIDFDPYLVEDYFDYVEIYEGNTTGTKIGEGPVIPLATNIFVGPHELFLTDTRSRDPRLFRSCATINIKFDAFSTEEEYDYLEIYDGGVISAPLIAK